MYENIICQHAAALLENDIHVASLPGSLLFSGPECSGKLSAALETARIVCCKGEEHGAWNCACPSCARHKSLLSQNLILAGPRDSTLEIAAAFKSFVDTAASGEANGVNVSSANGARYLFLRSVRKLTLRFSPVLLQDDDKINKIAEITSEIDALLEELDFPRPLPPADALAKSGEKIKTLCEKLESTYLADSIPIKQIRNISAWTHIKAESGTKCVIIENAERMNESARNALLKILEEPPEDTFFILTSTRRASVMPTILSRVRTYTFRERTPSEQTEVIRRIFREKNYEGTVASYLETFLPTSPDALRSAASAFFSQIACGTIPNCAKIVKDCGGFEPRTTLRIFLDGLAASQSGLVQSALGSEASAQCMDEIRRAWNDVAIYNQSVVASLEHLTRNFAKINKTFGGVFRTA